MAAVSDAARYLAKARESLASAEADFGAGRYNSCANRSYYAAFQAAVAVLITHGIGRRGRSWDHKHVIAEFSGRLVRRKVVQGELKGYLRELLEARLVADYRDVGVSARPTRRGLERARGVVAEADKLVLESNDGH